jgi:hypothetical protein
MEQWILNSNSGHTIIDDDDNDDDDDDDDDNNNNNNNNNNTYYSKDLRSHTIPRTSYAHICFGENCTNVRKRAKFEAVDLLVGA